MAYVYKIIAGVKLCEIYADRRKIIPKFTSRKQNVSSGCVGQFDTRYGAA
jgi:hypothetical protein